MVCILPGWEPVVLLLVLKSRVFEPGITWVLERTTCNLHLTWADVANKTSYFMLNVLRISSLFWLFLQVPNSLPVTWAQTFKDDVLFFEVPERITKILDPTAGSRFLLIGTQLCCVYKKWRSALWFIFLAVICLRTFRLDSTAQRRKNNKFCMCEFLNCNSKC